MYEKLISVMIPVYNVESYIKKSITSILEQSYQNFEIIVVDDGSTDDSLKIVYKMQEKDDRIRIFKNEKNRGVVVSRNKALEESKGEFIAIMDGDDVSSVNRLEELMTFLEENPEYDLVGSSCIIIDENGKEINKLFVRTDQSFMEETILLAPPVMHNWLARKKTYDSIGNYRAATVEDFDFLLRVKTAGYRFANIPECLYYHRIRQGNTKTSQGLKQAKALKLIRKLYKERLLSGTDSYNQIDFDKRTESSLVIQKIHTFSQNILQKGLVSENLFKKILLISFAAILSPYTLLHLYERMKFKYKVRTIK